MSDQVTLDTSLPHITPPANPLVGTTPIDVANYHIDRHNATVVSREARGVPNTPYKTGGAGGIFPFQMPAGA